VDGWWSG